MRRGIVIVLGMLASAASAQPFRLEHRLWFLEKPRAGQVEQARRVGVDAVVLAVAEAELKGTQATVTLLPPPEAELVRGLPLWAAVWVRGTEVGKEAAQALWNQVGPAVRGLGLPVEGLVLVGRSLPVGCFALARQLAKLAQVPVEVGAPVQQLLERLQGENAEGLTLVAFALGNLAAIGFAELTPQDAADLLARLDARGVRFRGAVAVASRVDPPFPEGQNPWELVSALEYRPGAEGDVLVAAAPVGSPGTSLPAGTRVLVQAYDGARMERDLGLLLRPVRHGLLGWDTVGQLAPAPALGLTWEGFLAFFSGQAPLPQPSVKGSWVSPTVLKLTLENPAPFASAFAHTGNVVDLRFSGTEVKDVTLQAAVGADFGTLDGGFTRTPRGAASAVRLYLKVVPPQTAVDLGTVSFLSRPRELAASVTVRLGDGRQASWPAVTLSPR